MQSFTSDFKIITPSPFSSDSLPDSDPALLTELASQVHEVLKAPRPLSNTGNIDIGQLALIPLTSDDITFLPEIRRRHQTKEAEKGVRKNGMVSGRQTSRVGASDPPCVSGQPITERQLIARKIRDIVKEVDGSEDISTSTGLNRQVRWTKTPGLYSPSLSRLDSSTDRKSGNSANAMEAALKAAKAVCFHSVSHRLGLI